MMFVVSKTIIIIMINYNYYCSNNNTGSKTKEGNLTKLG